jgi:hypothetical protein
MAKRSKTATADLGLRVKETLRSQIERAAKANGVSMNAEIVDRLERSFRPEGNSLLSAIIRHAIGSDPKYVPPVDGRTFGFSPDVKTLLKARLAAFVDSVPDAPPSTLTKEEEDELWELVQRSKKQIDAQRIAAAKDR